MFNYFNLNRKYKTFGSNIVWNGYRMLLVRLSTSSSDCPWPGMQDTHRDTDWSVEGYCWFHPSSKRTYVCESVSDHHFGHFKCHLLLETIDVLDFPLNHWIRRERSLWIRPAKATQVTQASISQLLPCKKRGEPVVFHWNITRLGTLHGLRLGSTLGSSAFTSEYIAGDIDFWWLKEPPFAWRLNKIFLFKHDHIVMILIFQ